MRYRIAYDEPGRLLLGLRTQILSVLLHVLEGHPGVLLELHALGHAGHAELTGLGGLGNLGSHQGGGHAAGKAEDLRILIPLHDWKTSFLCLSGTWMGSKQWRGSSETAAQAAFHASS